MHRKDKFHMEQLELMDAAHHRYAEHIPSLALLWQQLLLGQVASQDIDLTELKKGTWQGPLVRHKAF